MIMLATLKSMEIELVDLELSLPLSYMLKIELVLGGNKVHIYVDRIPIIPLNDIYVKSMEIELVDLELWIHYYTC